MATPFSFGTTSSTLSSSSSSSQSQAFSFSQSLLSPFSFGFAPISSSSPFASSSSNLFSASSALSSSSGSFSSSSSSSSSISTSPPATSSSIFGSSFGSGASSSPAFSSGSGSGSSSSLSLFGSSTAFGASSSSPSLFASSTPFVAFSSSSASTPIFGASSSSPSSSTSTPLFGASSSSSLFSSSASAPSFSTFTSLFAASSYSSSFSTPLFGAPSSSSFSTPSLFGVSTSTTTTNAMVSLAASAPFVPSFSLSSTTTSSSSLSTSFTSSFSFGFSMTSSPAATSVTATTLAPAIQSAFGFGSAAPTKPVSSLFSSSASSPSMYTTTTTTLFSSSSSSFSSSTTAIATTTPAVTSTAATTTTTAATGSGTGLVSIFALPSASTSATTTTTMTSATTTSLVASAAASTLSLFESTSSSPLFGTFSSISRSTLGANSTKTPLLTSTTRASSSGTASSVSLTSQAHKLPSEIAGKTVEKGKKGYSYYTMSSNKKISLKLLVDKKHCRVVLAESDKDFVDILLSFLTMPMGTICRLLGKDSSIGCVANLYESIQNLDAEHFQTKSCKTMLLRPLNAEDEHCENLVINIDDSKPRRFFTCVESASTTILLSLLGKLAENDGSILEERILYLGHEEILYLLRRTLTSKIPLTNLCFNSSATNYMPESSHMNGIFQLIPKSEFDGGSDFKEIKVKLLMTKSDNMVIHMEGGEGMANIVFSFLASALGSLIKLLDKNSSMGCVDNLYSSVENLCMQENDCIKSEQCKMMLLHPKLAPFFGCENQILLIDEKPPFKKCVHGCYLCKRSSGSKCTATWCYHGIGTATLKGLNPKSPTNGTEPGGGYARERGKFILTDDLRVSLISPISTINIINKLGVPVTDLVEKEMSIREAQTLNLLKAALVSKTALTDVFAHNKNKRRRVATV